MIRMPDTLAFRLTLWYALGLFLFLISAFLVLYFSVDSVFKARMDEDLMEDIAELGEIYREEGMTALENELDREVAAGDEQEIFRILAFGGAEKYNSSPSLWRELQASAPVPPGTSGEDTPLLFSATLAGEDTPRRFVSGKISADTVLQIGESLEEQQELLALLRSIFLILALLVIPLATLLGWLLSRRAVAGLKAVSKTAARISRGGLDSRVQTRGHGAEIEALSDTFNVMLDRIQSLVNSMREMTDNIAHDLRSPLARIRVISEMSLTNNKSVEEYQTAAAQTIEECDRLLQMINTTLDVAEAEADTGKFSVEDVDISRLTEDACELFQAVAEERGLDLHCRIQPGCLIRGNTNNLQRMLANLMDNALKYTPAPGEVRVELGCNKDNLTITVADTGVGIPAPEQERIFERFFRGDQSRSQEGCGLGLSFSRAVARAHGGDITVRSQIDEGSCFTIYLSP